MYRLIDRLYRLARPAVFRLTDPEQAHNLACRAIGYLGQDEWLAQQLADQIWRLGGYANYQSELGQTIGGVYFPNPFGIPAGFDKYGLIAYLLHFFGYGFAEAGTFTLPSRDGNPERPRLDRVPEVRGLLNRMSWNNPGSEAGAHNLAKGARSSPVIVNVGPTPEVESVDVAITSVIEALKFLAPRASAICLNPSCSNVEIVNFQDPVLLAELLDAIHASNVAGEQLILVKLDPDTDFPDLREERSYLDPCELGRIGSVCVERGAGLVLGNTRRTESGALSGPKLYEDMLARIGYIHREFAGKITTVACGGVETAVQAYEAIKRGAYLVQGLTGWIYGGPFWPREIVAGVSRLLKRECYANISEVRGTYTGR